MDEEYAEVGNMYYRHQWRSELNSVVIGHAFVEISSQFMSVPALHIRIIQIHVLCYSRTKRSRREPNGCNRLLHL